MWTSYVVKMRWRCDSNFFKPMPDWLVVSNLSQQIIRRGLSLSSQIGRKTYGCDPKIAGEWMIIRPTMGYAWLCMVIKAKYGSNW